MPLMIKFAFKLVSTSEANHVKNMFKSDYQSNVTFERRLQDIIRYEDMLHLTDDEL